MAVTELGILVICFIISAVSILITIFIMRAVFSIPTIVDNLKEQTRLLQDISATQSAILRNQRDRKQ